MWAVETTLATVKTGANGAHNSDNNRDDIDTKKNDGYKIGDVSENK